MKNKKKKNIKQKHKKNLLLNNFSTNLKVSVNLNRNEKTKKNKKTIVIC